MGSFSLEAVLPKRLRDPDRSVPIDRIGLPLRVMAMRAGFNRGAAGPIVFEGSTEVSFRIVERLWSYRRLPDPSIETASRWRLEFAADVKEGPLAPGHQVVVAQEPYSNGWLQHAAFKMYSKRSDTERPIQDIPELNEIPKDPIGWLEQHGKYDPWEKDARLVAGISQPNGFFRDRPRNSTGDLILGMCPEFDGLVGELWTTQEVQHLLQLTRENSIEFWKRGKLSHKPRLYPEVIEDSYSLMTISIQQALAGPRHSPDRWIGQPVWKLADLIYRDHLNERNRAVFRRQRRERAPNSSDLW